MKGKIKLSLLFLLILPLVLNADEGKSDDAIIVYGRDPDDKKIESSELDKYRGLSNSDLFSSEPSIQANNMRNEAGAIDIGIRGIQGEGRVPILIDGSLQSTHTSRGYQGTSDRTYIDSDLISAISLQKGASERRSPFATGASGGVVNITTLTPQDILNPGQDYGLLVKLRTFNNNRKPTVPSNYKQQDYYYLTDRPASSKFNNGSGTVAFAAKGDVLETVLAYSERATGNYFAGKGGFSRYVEPVINPREEVVNTSFESQSFLYKLGITPDNDQRLELTYRNHRQKAGEVLAAYWYKHANDENINPLPLGIEVMPQWKPGSAIVNAYSAQYSYDPDNLLVNYHMGIWMTRAKLKQYNGLWADGVNAEQYLHAYNNNRWGVTAYNESELTAIPVTFRYGAAFQDERIYPENDGQLYYTRYPTSRNGKRNESSLFLNGTVNLPRTSIDFGGNLHGSKTEDNQQRYTLKYSPKVDLYGGVDYSIIDGANVFIKMSRSYRMPSLYETTVSNEVFSYNQQNKITPEISTQYEIGVKSKLSNMLMAGDETSLNVSYFRNRINGFISGGIMDKTQNLPDWMDNFTFMNYDKLDLSGIELSADYKGSLFYVKTLATIYTNTQVCSHYLAERADTNDCNKLGFAWGLTPTRIPAKRNFVVNVGRFFLQGDLDIGARYKYHSAKKNPADWLESTAASPVLEIPSGYQIDLYAQYIVNKNMTLYSSINNLTNRYDIQPGAVISMPEPGRTITVGADIRF